MTLSKRTLQTPVRLPLHVRRRPNGRGLIPHCQKNPNDLAAMRLAARRGSPRARQLMNQRGIYWRKSNG